MRGVMVNDQRGVKARGPRLEAQVVSVSYSQSEFCPERDVSGDHHHKGLGVRVFGAPPVRRTTAGLGHARVTALSGRQSLFGQTQITRRK